MRFLGSGHTRRLGWLGLSWAVGCASSAAPSRSAESLREPAPMNVGATAVDVEPRPIDGEARLTDAAIPLRYDLHFDLDPKALTYAGEVRIAVRLAEATRRIDLHASKMEILDASFHPAGSSHVVAAHVEYGRATGIAVHLAEDVLGEGTLRLTYRAGLEEAPESLYRVRQGDEWYVFSQFQPQMAREAFPCFDEPRFKTPFAVTVTAPVGVTVVGNSPSLRTEVGHAEGRQTVTFADTAPIPTYLVALAVGPFERQSADLPQLGRNGGALPHSIYTVRGKRVLTSYASQVTGSVLASLVGYLGSPYPFQKLDQVAVPNFHAGAMENVGLVTYRESILLLDAERASERDRIRARSIIAHELAHMWFGNLVTAQWWDDIWLNEALATWMSAKVLTDIAPELETPIASVANMLSVMQRDASSSARPIYKQISGNEDVDNAFDAITYEKGFAVLRMLENWLGPERFQHAIRDYLKRHAWGSATKRDFIGALASVSEQPVAEVSEAFISRAGIPLVEVTRQCVNDANGSERTRLRLEQSRYVPLGAAALTGDERAQTWTIPVCLSVLGQGVAAASPVCVLLNQPEMVVDVPGPGCGQAVYPNAGELGYYHIAVPNAEWEAFGQQHWSKLSIGERVGLPWHALALFESGRMDLGTFAKLLTHASRDPHRLVLEGVIAGLEAFSRVASNATERTALSKFAAQLLAPHVQRLGRTPKPHESASNALMRTRVLEALGRWAPDDALKRAGARLAKRFVNGEKELDLTQLQLLLPIAGSAGDATLHTALLARLGSTTPGERVVTIMTLGLFSDPMLLRRSYATLLDGTVLPTERHLLMRGAGESEERGAVFWAWYRENEAELMQRSGARTVSELPEVAGLLCTAAQREEARAHFSDLSRYGEASETVWRETAEDLDRCIALRERYSSELVSGLGVRP
jgi:alanyl aminopeptidase